MEAREARPVERKRLTDVGVGFNKILVASSWIRYFEHGSCSQISANGVINKILDRNAVAIISLVYVNRTWTQNRLHITTI